MPAAVNSRGFSLPEVMLAMFLMVSVVTALGGYYRGLATASLQLSQYRQMWRQGWVQTQQQAMALPDGWQSQRLQTSSASCVSINATIITPMGRQGRMTRLHCPVSQ